MIEYTIDYYEKLLSEDVSISPKFKRRLITIIRTFIGNSIPIDELKITNGKKVNIICFNGEDILNVRMSENTSNNLFELISKNGKSQMMNFADSSAKHFIQNKIKRLFSK